MVALSKLSIFGLVESKVGLRNKYSIENYMLHGWQAVDNFDLVEGGRIWLFWNPEEVKLIARTDQAIHVEVSATDLPNFHLTIVYGSIEYRKRKELWQDRTARSNLVGAWSVMGD